MSALPVPRRKYHAFLSHAHVNREVVDRVYAWLSEAGIPVWYDTRDFPPSSGIGSELLAAIEQCRSTMVVLSDAAVKSGWVQMECEYSADHRTQFPDFRIVPIRIDDCEVPPILRTTSRIDVPGGRLDLGAAEAILTALCRLNNWSSASESRRDVYMSRSWRESEASVPNEVCRLLDSAGFRLIGDSEDQQGFQDGQRVESLIASCGGLAAVLPDRGEGSTSKYILREIAIAREKGLSSFLVAESAVKELDETGSLLRFSTAELPSLQSLLRSAIEQLSEEWRTPAEPHYVFFATDFEPANAARKTAAQRVIERVTAMPCVMGDHIREGQIQELITERIRRAFFVIADISEENLNTCIEAGVARGAGTRLHLVARGPRRKPPFLFRDYQVWHYDDDIDMLGKIYRIVHPYRRRVLNDEIGQPM